MLFTRWEWGVLPWTRLHPRLDTWQGEGSAWGFVPSVRDMAFAEVLTLGLREWGPLGRPGGRRLQDKTGRPGWKALHCVLGGVGGLHYGGGGSAGCRAWEQGQLSLFWNG